MDRAGDLLKEFLRRQGVKGDEPVVSLFGGWGRLVNPPLLDHSRIIDLKNGILWVEVDHPGWMQVLQLQQARILRQVRRQYPQLKIRGLSCRVNLRLTPLPVETKETEAGQPVAEEGDGAEEAARVVSEVREPELKGLLARLFTRVIERGRGGEPGSGPPR